MAWLKEKNSIYKGTRKLDIPFISDRELIFPDNLINSENVVLYLEQE